MKDYLLKLRLVRVKLPIRGILPLIETVNPVLFLSMNNERYKEEKEYQPHLKLL
jgi:hypothetical protein